MLMRPHVRCTRCEAVFASDASLEDEVECPECGNRGHPAGIMKPSGFPSLEEFRRHIEASRDATSSQE